MSKKFLIVGADGLQAEELGYGTSEFLDTSSGAGDAGKPIVLDAAGLIDPTMVNVGSIDHGGLSGLGDDDHTIYTKADGTRAFSGDQSMSGNKLTNLADPSTATDAATRQYVDSVAAGLQLIGNVEAASTANLNLTSMPATVDGVTLSAGDRFLAKDQTDPKENGVYDFNGTAAAATRSEDQDNSPLAEIVNGVLMPRTMGGTANSGIPFVITSQGTGTDGVHTIGVDDITFGVFTSPTELSAGTGVDAAALATKIIQMDLLASGGLKFTGQEVGIEPADFSGEGLVDDGADNMAIDWSTAYNDSKAIKASELSSTTNGQGASIIGIEDASGDFTATDVEGALGELFGLIGESGVIYTADAAITKGQPCYISSNDAVSPYSNTSVTNRVIGLALTTESSSSPVKILANDTVLTGVLSSATAGQAIYWDGTNLTSSIPSGSGSYVWQCGVAKNASDLAVEVRFVKKNA